MKATLTTLTPVHIGNGQTLNKNIDFAREGDRIGFFDLDKIVKLIGIDQIEQLTNVIEHNKPMLDFLRNGRGLKNPLEDFCNRTCEVRRISLSTSQLKEHYHTSLNGVCIPGSSLKGAMKTAIWDNVLNEDILNKTFVAQLKNFRGKWSDINLDKKLFGKTANEKITRFLKIGDIHFPESETKIYETIIINQQYDDWQIKEGNRFLLECIPTGSISGFNFSLDKEILEKNVRKYPNAFNQLDTHYIKDKKLLFKLINSFTKVILNWEIDELEEKKFDNLNEGNELLDKYAELRNSLEHIGENELIIRVGGNSGWRFTTGGWITKEALSISDSDFSSLKRSIQKRVYPNSVLLPKTRKTTSTGIPFGFVKITLPND